MRDLNVYYKFECKENLNNCVGLTFLYFICIHFFLFLFFYIPNQPRRSNKFYLITLFYIKLESANFCSVS